MGYGKNMLKHKNKRTGYDSRTTKQQNAEKDLTKQSANTQQVTATKKLLACDTTYEASAAEPPHGLLHEVLHLLSSGNPPSAVKFNELSWRFRLMAPAIC